MKKKLLILAVLAAVLVIALDYYVQSDAFSARLRPYLLSPLQEMLGPGARIGLIKANALPLYVEVRDVFIPGESGSDTVHIRKVRISLNPFSLLLKRISLPTITLREPHVRLTRSANGELPLLRMVERIKAKAGMRPKEGASRFTLQLDTLSVHNGTVTFQDKVTETTATVSDITLIARLQVPANQATVLVRSAAIRVVARSQPELTFSIRGRAGYEFDKLTLSSLELVSPDAKVTASGVIATRPDGDVNIIVKGSFGQQALGRFSALLNNNEAKRQRSLMDLAVSVRGKRTDPAVEGALTLYNIPYNAFTVQEAGMAFSYRDRRLSLTGKQWRIAKAQNKMMVDRVTAVLENRTSGFDIKKMELVAGDLVVRAIGRLDRAHGYDAELTIDSSGKSKTLSFLTGVPLEGKAALSGRLTGELFSPVFDGALVAGPVTIKEVLFHDAAGRVQLRDNKISFSTVDIHQLGSRYILDGSIDFSRDIVYNAHLKVVRSDVVSVVALFYKPLPLQLSATGEITFAGSSKDFSGSAELILGPGSAYGESFSKGSLAVALTPERISFPRLVLRKGNGVVEGNGWIDFSGAYSARLTSRGVDLSEVDHLAGIPLSGIFELDINSRGPFSAPTVKAVLTLDELGYRQSSLGGYNAKLTIDAGRLVFESDLFDKKARLAGSMDLRSPYAWNASVNLQAADMAPFIVPGGSEALSRTKFVTDGKIAVHGRGGAVSAVNGSAVFQRVSVAIGDYRLENDGAAAVNIEAGRLLVKALNFNGPGTRMAVTGSSRIMKDFDLTFTGKANLSLLRLLYREVEHSDGNAFVNITVRDAWEKPEIAGVLRLENGELRIKDIPQKFSGLNGAIDFNQERVVIDSLTGEVGGGAMKLSGWLQLARFVPGEFSAKMDFDNVTVRYPPGLVATLSGDLYYDGNAAEQNLSGDVLIKRALYNKQVEWKSMLLETFKGFSQRKNMEIGWIGETRLNVRFHGKESILIQNNLAKIPLEVDTFIQGTPNQPHLLGRLEARTGVAYFRRNDFKIQHASVDFVDPNRINPVLDIQAETRVREYVVRLTVSGAADRALVTFVSDPPLSEMDVLSMLVLGKTSADLKGKGAEVGMSEAASFATGQFQDVFERRARSLTGLDRFQVDPYLSKDASVPRVTVGKELIQDKLYFTYSSNVGTSTPDTVVRIEYVLDKHFSLVGEQNELGTIGGDVKFRFEFK